jgi:hypothetical protein
MYSPVGGVDVQPHGGEWTYRPMGGLDVQIHGGVDAQTHGGMDVHIRVFLTLALVAIAGQLQVQNALFPTKLPLLPIERVTWWTPERI